MERLSWRDVQGFSRSRGEAGRLGMGLRLSRGRSVAWQNHFDSRHVEYNVPFVMTSEEQAELVYLICQSKRDMGGL